MERFSAADRRKALNRSEFAVRLREVWGLDGDADWRLKLSSCGRQPPPIVAAPLAASAVRVRRSSTSPIFPPGRHAERYEDGAQASDSGRVIMRASLDQYGLPRNSSV
jgi:hypothetical protein